MRCSSRSANRTGALRTLFVPAGLDKGEATVTSACVRNCAVGMQRGRQWDESWIGVREESRFPVHARGISKNWTRSSCRTPRRMRYSLACVTLGMRWSELVMASDW